MTRKEAELRAAIVAEALTWELTRYEDHQRIKRRPPEEPGAVDCAQLPAAIYGPEGVDLIPDLRPEYASDWMNHRDEELYLEEIRRWSHEIDIEAIQPGDLVVWKFGRTYSHSAIVIDPPIVIHAVKRVGMVIRTDINAEEDYRDRARKAFSIFPLKRRRRRA